jgi:hypothetical protein
MINPNNMKQVLTEMCTDMDSTKIRFETSVLYIQ